MDVSKIQTKTFTEEKPKINDIGMDDDFGVNNSIKTIDQENLKEVKK